VLLEEHTKKNFTVGASTWPPPDRATRHIREQ
jgi:hypothetical protein